MSTKYNLELYSPIGVGIKNLNDVISFEYARKENEVGTAVFVFKAKDYPLDYWSIDQRIAVYRQPTKGYKGLDGDTVWLVRDKTQSVDSEGKEVTVVHAFDLIHILKRRIIAYDTDTSYTSKADVADDMMKEIIDENFGASAVDTSRDISSWLSIEGDLTLGPSVYKACARRNILDTLREIAESSYSLGYRLIFDIYASSPTNFMFRTWVPYRGIDRSKSTGDMQVIVSPDFGNLTEASISLNRSDEVNYIYGGGAGEAAGRVIQAAYDDNRILESPFNLCEMLLDSKQTEDPLEVLAEAEQYLKQTEPRYVFSGRVINTLDTVYGRDYRYGDIITAKFAGLYFDCYVNGIHVSVSGSAENIDTLISSV